MLYALWIILIRMVIIFAVLGVVYLAIIILKKAAQPRVKTEEKQ